MKPRIGIVSLYIGQNFGNKLQNYAVEKIVESFGFIAETFKYEVDYSRPVVSVPSQDKLKPKYIENFLRYRLSRIIPMKNSDSSFIRRCLWLGKQKVLQDAKDRQIESYRRFDAEYLHFSNHKIGLHECNETWTNEYAYFFCGSDQVWNPYYQTTGRNCFLQFAPKEKRIAFAPSFGVASIPEERKLDYRKWISEIPNLSVREEAGREIIFDLTGRNAEVLVDPTMVLTAEDWDEFAKEPLFNLPQKYILTYFLGDRIREYSRAIYKYAEELDCQVVNLLDLMEPQYYGCSPNEFVYCIKNAEMICTDSFHAAVFSIMYHKNFQVFERVEGERTMSSRLHTLLKTYHLQDCFWNGANSEIVKCNWIEVDKIVDEKRKIVQNYLRKAFQTLDKGQNSIEYNYPTIYSGFLKDKTKLLRSASGGAATAISEAIIQQGGCVFGVAYTTDFKAVEYICCETLADLEKIKGSKYTETKKNLPLLIQKLQDGRIVLFIGLGCDVVAAYSYCKAKNVSTEKLYTIDILCHGPVPALVHQRFVEDLEKKYRSKVISFTSRSKRDGWSSSSLMKVEFENGRLYEELFDDTDYGYIFTHYALPRCLNCKFKGSNHQGDLCLGDHWGISAKHSEWNKMGVSILIEQKEKGKELLNMLDERFQIVQTDSQFAIDHNQAYIKSRITETSLKSLLQSLEKGGLHASLKNDTEYQKWKRKTKEIEIKRAILRVVRKNKNG